MKTKGLMFIALFISGASFAQTATVKQEQQVKASAKNEVNASAGNQRVAATTNTSSEINARSASGASAGQMDAQAGVGHNEESAVAIDPSAISSAKGKVKAGLESGLEAGVAAGAHVEAQALKAGKAAGAQVKNVTAAAVRGATQVNAGVNNSLKIKAAPVNVNAISSGAIRLKGL